MQIMLKPHTIESEEIVRVAILHTRLNILGGGERVCLGIIRTLKERYGATVDLYSLDKPKWQEVEKKFGKEWVMQVNEYPMAKTDVLVPVFSIYQRLILSTISKIRSVKKHHDLVINTIGDFNLGVSDITYMHYPFETLDINSKYRNSNLWKLYSFPYTVYQNHNIKENIKKTYLLCNSLFTMQTCESVYGRFNGEVVYPPVDDKNFAELRDIPFMHRKKSVITISRLSQEKRLETIMKIASQLPDVVFHIVGGTSAQYANTLLSIKQLASSSPNVSLHFDASNKEILELLSQCRLYLHTMIQEHFGISIVEAMHSGLPVIVHRSGGQYTDVIDCDRYGMSYTDDQEAVNHIMNTINDETSWERYHQMSIERSKNFTFDIFEKNMTRVIDKVIQSKNKK
ncbi:MAG: glycosyltransferase involved in cell wall biosynthesis [Candidatus Nitrosomirales archaeon]|jgi:glycosyltransferase involved in cell wall biosynthesis